MKIGLFLSAVPSCGGTYHYTRLLLECFKHFQDRCQCVVFYTDPHWAPLVQNKEIEGERVYPSLAVRLLAALWRRMRLPLALLRSIFAKSTLGRQFQKQQCDMWFFPSQEAYAYLLPVPAIIAVHDLMHRYERSFEEVGAPKHFKAREYHCRATCSWAKGLLVDSFLGKQHVVESYEIDPSLCYVLPYIAPPQPTVSWEEWERWSALPQKFFFYPAQFWAHKNHLRLLQAFAAALKEAPDMRLILVGSPKNAYASVVKAIHAFALTNHVALLGLVPDPVMPILYQKARALVMPTFFGPTNIPPLEALAFGCPAAVSRVYAMPEQLEDAVLYFDPYSINEMADCLLRLWKDDALCQSLVEKGKRLSQKKTFEHFKDRLWTIMEEAVLKNK